MMREMRSRKVSSGVVTDAEYCDHYNLDCLHAATEAILKVPCPSKSGSEKAWEKTNCFQHVN